MKLIAYLSFLKPS